MIDVLDPYLVGDNVIRIIKLKGLSQGDVESMCGIGKNNLSYIINAKHSPKVITLQKIAWVLDVDIREFFKPRDEWER